MMGARGWAAEDTGGARAAQKHLLYACECRNGVAARVPHRGATSGAALGALLECASTGAWRVT
eukprot:3039221-Prymnesium_polylepis.1